MKRLAEKIGSSSHLRFTDLSIAVYIGIPVFTDDPLIVEDIVDCPDRPTAEQVVERFRYRAVGNGDELLVLCGREQARIPDMAVQTEQTDKPYCPLSLSCR